MVSMLGRLLPLGGALKHRPEMGRGFFHSRSQRFVSKSIQQTKRQEKFSAGSFAVDIKTPAQQTACRRAAFVATSKFYLQKHPPPQKKWRSASAKTQHKVSGINSTCTFIVPQIYLQRQIRGLHYPELSAGYWQNGLTGPLF